MSKVIGLNVEKYIGDVYQGHNLDFEVVKTPMERYHLMCVRDDGSKFIIHLENESSTCGSGWCVAQYGKLSIEEVDKFGPFGYIPKHDLFIDFDYTEKQFEDRYQKSFVEENTYECSVFTFDAWGGDRYYPWGGVTVNLDLFIKTKRGKDKRPVWIISGQSGLGKSYLFNNIQNISFYETDIDKHLPDIINESIIIIGNKYQFNIDDVVKRIPEDSEIILINFKKYQ